MAKADREPVVMYRTWCPAAGETATNGFLELGALDAENAARIHAERMPQRAWDAAHNSPDELCATCGKPRHPHRLRHPFKSSRPNDRVEIAVQYGDDGRNTHFFVVRRVMKPVFEVVL